MRRPPHKTSANRSSGITDGCLDVLSIFCCQCKSCNAACALSLQRHRACVYMACTPFRPRAAQVFRERPGRAEQDAYARGGDLRRPPSQVSCHASLAQGIWHDVARYTRMQTMPRIGCLLKCNPARQCPSPMFTLGCRQADRCVAVMCASAGMSLSHVGSDKADRTAALRWVSADVSNGIDQTCG